MLTALLQAYRVATNRGPWVFQSVSGETYRSGLEGKYRRKSMALKHYAMSAQAWKALFCGNFTGYYVSRKGDMVSTSVSTPVSCHPLNKKVFMVNQYRVLEALCCRWRLYLVLMLCGVGGFFCCCC